MILFTSAQVGEVLQRLYNSEIDISLISEFNEGFTVGVKAHPKPDFRMVDGPKSKSVISTIDAVAFQVSVNYPNSDFAKWYNSDAQVDRPASHIDNSTWKQSCKMGNAGVGSGMSNLEPMPDPFK